MIREAVRLAPLTAALLLAAGDVAAQTRTDTAAVRVAAASGTYDEGWRDGRAAAGRRGVLGRAVGGFIGGLPLGFVGPFVLSDRDAPQLLAAGVGIAVVGSAVFAGPAAPPAALTRSAAARGATYAAAYRDGYATRLRSRRRTSAFVGAATGAAAGLALLLGLVSQIDS